jgi:hypothetical protein
VETTQEPEILFTCDNSGVGTLMLNRPDRLNAFGPSMLKAWAQTLDDAQADPKVRRKAIAMLGSMSSPEAMRKLRLLKQRESDSSIADQINQVLLAAGTPSSTIR